MKVIITVMLTFFLTHATVLGMKVPQVDLHITKEEYAISFLPVLHGEVAVIHLSSGGNYLINTGTIKEKDQLYYYLKQLQIQNLKAIVITEKSEVHEDMIKELMKRYSVDELIIGKTLAPSISEGLSQQTRRLEEGQTYTVSEGLVMNVLHEGSDEGEGLDFSITFFHHRFLWLSSQSAHGEEVLLTHSLKNVNIVKIPLHSKAENMSHRLLKHIDPQTAILYRSKEKLLNGDMLEAINEAWIDLYLTGQHGLIAVKFNRRNYEVLTFDNRDGA
ncbi:hypothetical protein [Bacillus sp. KH172YL63]|uniref:hypothetical protein n=1 Tax=Bacillus sp. KH172YL63 TaxID=2709784 RepID=UPI0013E4EF92|nr:hypothetical protein [Bacillus sp. KH172YL63]BCB04503.1 hypothetical protein KH172YL63_26360 [Bacillus sp. KH172YL63]